MREEIVNKYSKPVPRYTSYPPANFFNESYTAGMYRQAIADSNRQKPEYMSFYMHLPFCYQLCYYCGCNAMQLRDRQNVDRYIQTLKKEIRMVLPMLSHERKISQIHYGGGTPTLVPLSVLEELNGMLLSEFSCIDIPEIAIECHPGYMDEEYWEKLPALGFTRVSIGLQDFNEDVLTTVRRKKPRVPVETIMQILRQKKIDVNFDFIYGLPGQTVQSFTATIEKAIALNPDRIVTFSYAHVPWVNPLQKNLEAAGLPDAELKSELFAAASHLLNEAGYRSIGLDHFVRPDDELYIAAQEKMLHRNFQGYCSRRTTGQVYAFGVTGISQLASSYSQNLKDIDAYTASVDRGELPVLKGYALSREEQIARDVITTLMCNYQIHWQEIAAEFGMTVAGVKQVMNYQPEVLAEFAADGIIEFTDDYIRMCPEATPFVRNVAGGLDRLMVDNEKRFSKSV